MNFKNKNMAFSDSFMYVTVFNTATFINIFYVVSILDLFKGKVA